jgi:hypothetical protein
MLTEADRELCSFAAQLLMGLVDPGPPREDAAERLLEHYRAYLSDAHPGADPAVLDDMAVTFGGAMLLEMEATEPGASRGISIIRALLELIAKALLARIDRDASRVGRQAVAPRFPAGSFQRCAQGLHRRCIQRPLGSLKFFNGLL